VEETALTRAVQRKAAFLVATDVLDTGRLGDLELIQTYKEQQSVERGFSFLKDPLFLASSVFVKKPSRIVALSLIMVLYLLVYRLAEHRLRTRLAATGQTVPNQLKRPTDRRRCAGCSSVLKGLACWGSRSPMGRRTALSRVWSRCTSKSWLYWGRPVKNSTKSTIEAAECALYRHVAPTGALRPDGQRLLDAKRP
jgi:hypothetical protein